MAHNEQNRKREPLKWIEAETFDNGSVRAKLSVATTKPRGNQTGRKMYSITFSRIGQNREGDTFETRFFRPDDLRCFSELESEINNWIDCDRAERANSSSRV